MGQHIEPTREQRIYSEEFLRATMPYEDWNDEHHKKTPERFARMFLELTSRVPYDFTTFKSDSDEMVVVQDITFTSLCAHHIIPFMGRAHVAYVPDGKIAGLSKFARCVRYHAAGLWTQEGLTTAIAQDLQEKLSPLGLAVVLKAEHLCMTIRGVQAPGAITTTSAMLGVFADHSRQARSEFLSLLK